MMDEHIANGQHGSCIQRLSKIRIGIGVGIGIGMLALSTHVNAEQNSASEIKTLAASCAACHGPQGNSVGGTPSLAGLNAELFIQQMLGFRQGSLPASVMHQHAKGLTEAEIRALAYDFAQQPRQQPVQLPRQRFLGAPA